MTTAETYVTAAYLVFLAVVLLYVVIYSFRVAQLERAVADLTPQLESSPATESEAEREPVVVA
jgi:hypothetical protein